MPDQVSLGVRNPQLRQALALGFKFLHPVLAEQRQPRTHRLGHRLRRMHFRNPHQPHVLARAARATACRRNLLLHPLQPFPKAAHVRCPW